MMLLSRTSAPCARPGLQRSPCNSNGRPVVVVRRLQPLAAAGDSDAPGGGSSKPPRRRSSSKNAGSSNGDVPPSPATQLANNIASSGGSSSSSGSGSVPPSPATQLANNLSTGSSTTPASPSAQVASNMASSSSSPGTPASSSSSRPSAAEPSDLLQQGVRAAADTAEGAIINSAAVAAGGIEAAASLTQSGLTAAEAAAEDAVRSLGAAAQSTLNAAAATVGAAAGVVDGVGQSVARGGAAGRRGGGSAAAADSSADFETVNVRVPGGSAWANATPEKGRVRDSTLTQDFDEDEVEECKVRILAAVASLDRGLAANVREARDVDRLCRQLEDAAGPITLKWTTSRSSPNKSTMDRLAGTWRLIYSSGFNGGSLGGSRPGPPAALVPTILGQVYQVINAQAMTLDNVVELLLNLPVPQLPFLPSPEPQPAPGLRLSLHHTYEVTPPSSVKIVFESTSAKAIGPDLLQGLPELGVPDLLPAFLKPPKDLRSATFSVTYLDKSMRVTRGDRGELRIYLRDRPLSPSLPMDDSDRDYE